MLVGRLNEASLLHGIEARCKGTLPVEPAVDFAKNTEAPSVDVGIVRCLEPREFFRWRAQSARVVFLVGHSHAGRPRLKEAIC